MKQAGYTALAGPARGGFRGYIVPGPGLGGPGRVKVVTSSFGPTGPNMSEDLFYVWSKFEWRPFFWSSPNFGQNSGPNLSEDLFFFGLSSPNFGQKSGPNLSKDLSWFNFTKFWGPGVDLRTPCKNFYLRPWPWLLLNCGEKSRTTEQCKKRHKVKISLSHQTIIT